MAVCGCAADIYGGENLTSCSFDQFISCAFVARDPYITDPSIEANCGCLSECEETSYDVSICSSPMPHAYAKKSLLDSLNVPHLNASNIDQNIISLKVFFGEMRYTLIEQQSMCTWVSLFGELGGQLGLCLGASVLTIAELLQLLGTLCVRFCGRKEHTATTNDVPLTKSKIVKVQPLN